MEGNYLYQMRSMMMDNFDNSVSSKTKFETSLLTLNFDAISAFLKIYCYLKNVFQGIRLYLWYFCIGNFRK